MKRMPLRGPVLLVAALLGAWPPAGTAQDQAAGGGQIRGRVLDALSAAPLSQVSVTLRGTLSRGYTDRAGRFAITGIPPGTYTLVARVPGHEPLIRDGITVTDGSSLELELVLQPVPIRLRDIVVSPGAFAFIESGPASRQVMSREDIESVPQFGEDIFRAVNRVPGLASGDYTAGFSIRGGRRDETLILLDGLEIYEPYHLKDFNEGAISIVDVEAIEGAELLTGGFPARYGNRTAGVFSLTSRDPRGSDTRASLGLSFINARAMAQGNFAAERGSWFFSARRGYFDLVLDLLGITDIPAPSYHDLFGKVRYDLHPRHSLAFHVLHARDGYTLDGLATTGFNDSIPTREVAGNRYGNSYGWMTLRSALGRRLTVTSMVSAGLVTTTRDGSEFHRVVPDTIYAITNRRDFDVLGFKQDWQYEVSDRLLLEAGADLRRFSAEYALVNRVWQDPDDPVRDTSGTFPVSTRLSRRRTGTAFAGYLGGRVRPFRPLTIELGLRHDRVSYAGDRDWSPRAGALLRIGDSRHLRLGWGYYRQSQQLADLAALDGLGRYFPSELSRQWTAGFEQRLAAGGELRVEAYHRRGSRLRPVYRNWKGVIDVFPETDDDRMLVFPAATTSRGLEISLARELSSRFSLRGSYALSSAEEEVSRIRPVNDPAPLVFRRTHPAPQDQRHAVHLDLTYRPSPKWSVYASYAFHTGWPATLERQVPIPGSGGSDFTIRPGGLYGARLPNYQRMDVRVTKRAGNLRFYLEVLNLTNNENVSGWDYFRAPGPGGQVVLQRDPETWFIILPSLGVSWSRSF